MSLDDQLQKEAEHIIRIAGRKHLKNKLNGFELDKARRENPRTPLLRWLSAAAVAAILVLLPLWWIQTTKVTTPEAHFTAYFEPYRNPENIRGESPAAETLWENAAAMYADKNYHAAALHFEQLAEKDDNYLVWFYLGQSLLNLEPSRANEAANAFKVVLKTDNDYQQQAQWYLALSYLKGSNPEDAKQMLSEIAGNKAHYKQKEAARLVKKF